MEMKSVWALLPLLVAGCSDSSTRSTEESLDLKGKILYEVDQIALPNREAGESRVPLQAVHYWEFGEEHVAFTTELLPHQEKALRSTRMPFGVTKLYHIEGSVWGVEESNGFEGRLYFHISKGERVVFDRTESGALISTVEPLSSTIFSLDYLHVGGTLRIGDGTYRSISQDSLAGLLK